MIINQGFFRKRDKNDKLPPGQFETKGFPVLSLGPTPEIDLKTWELKIDGLVENQLSWNFEQFNKLPQTKFNTDIHCVTKWSKFDSNWEGVSVDEIIKLSSVKPNATHIIAYSYDGYSTNLPTKDIINGQAIIGVKYEGKDIESQHGGPVRLLVPHLYFWKSAKWLNRIEFVDHDQPGFWETRGYHNYGDPWKEQRYSTDE